jgi:hypothetical protein
MENRKRTSGKGANTLSFDPKTSIQRPDMRIIVGDKADNYGNKLTHDDVVIIKHFFEESNLYSKLLEELKEKGINESDFIEWHEGSHLITKNPDLSPTFKFIIQKMADYFGIDLSTAGTRFNLYRDNSDWKPLHHDSAAFNKERAKHQNITVGVSFGTSRELSFYHVKGKTRLSFPQENNMIFSFGKDVNIRFMHGVNALSDEEKKTNNGKRISIILWGYSKLTIDQPNSPEMIPERKHTKSRIQTHYIK